MGACFSSIDYNNMTFNNTNYFSLNNMILPAKVVDIYDGDTITLIIYIFDKYHKFIVRLADIDTCEIKGNHNPNLKKRAIQARNRLFNLVTKLNIDLDSNITRKEMREKLNNSNYIVNIVCGEFDKYGRLLGWIFDKNEIKQEKYSSYNYNLLNEGLAYVYNGGTKVMQP